MIQNFLDTLLKKKKHELFVSVDIGSSTIKIAELNLENGKPKLVSAGIGATPEGAISNNVITSQQKVADAIRNILDANKIKTTKAIIAIPGSTVFTKKVQMPYADPKTLANTIQFEAANYIPHNIRAVKIDFQILKSKKNGSMEVLLVATKNEVIDSYVNAVTQAGLEPSIADVDYFAIENVFEHSYPEEKEKTVALVNFGNRYTTVNLVKEGVPLFTGDISIGGKQFVDALAEALSVKPAEAAKILTGESTGNVDPNMVREIIERTMENVNAELHRQLGFFWNASATDKPIEAIYLSGGACSIPGLLEDLTAKTGLNCRLLEAFKNVTWEENFDPDYIQEIAPTMGVSIGLAMRRFGDKHNAESSE